MVSVQVCEPATVPVVEGILVEFIGMDWSTAHTPIPQVHTQSWVAEELMFNELDEELFAVLQSPVVTSSSKSSIIG